MGRPPPVLQNYEKQTGDVLARKDLTEKGLAQQINP